MNIYIAFHSGWNSHCSFHRHGWWMWICLFYWIKKLSKNYLVVENGTRTRCVSHAFTRTTQWKKFANQLAVRHTALTFVLCLLGLFDCKCYFFSFRFTSSPTRGIALWHLMFYVESEFTAVLQRLAVLPDVPAPSEHLLLWNTTYTTPRGTTQIWHFRFQYAVHLASSHINKIVYSRMNFVSGVNPFFRIVLIVIVWKKKEK